MLSPFDSLNIIPFQKYIVKRFFQKNRIFLIFFTFFYFLATFIFSPIFLRAHVYIYNRSRVHIRVQHNKKQADLSRLVSHSYPINQIVNDSHRRFCSCPCIFLRSVPWKNTSSPYNRAPSCHRNRDTPLRPCKPSQVLQNAFRKRYIYTVKKAFSPPHKQITLLLYL